MYLFPLHPTFLSNEDLTCLTAFSYRHRECLGGKSGSLKRNYERPITHDLAEQL